MIIYLDMMNSCLVILCKSLSYNTTTESLFTAGTFANGFEITGGDTYHRRLMTYGPPSRRITGGDERFRRRLGV